ncbi:MAG TPA: ATP-binding protein [Acidimicrobiales bacterium]|nr:ATP-binding protein [Acidimicrobiales bacterium]
MAAAVRPLRVTLQDMAALPEARHCLADWLGQVRMGENVKADLVTAAGELCANAVRAATTSAEMTARVEAHSVVVEVVDDGEPADIELPEEPPPSHMESGRGLYLVRQLVDVLWIRQLPEGQGTKASFARRLDA